MAVFTTPESGKARACRGSLTGWGCPCPEEKELCHIGKWRGIVQTGRWTMPELGWRNTKEKCDRIDTVKTNMQHMELGCYSRVKGRESVEGRRMVV